MDLNITPVATQLKTPQSMSLADMINVGRGGIQLQKERQANTERVGLQDFFPILKISKPTATLT